MLHCCRSTPLPATLIVTATDSIASDFDRAPARIWVSGVGVAPYGVGADGQAGAGGCSGGVDVNLQVWNPTTGCDQVSPGGTPWDADDPTATPGINPPRRPSPH